MYNTLTFESIAFEFCKESGILLMETRTDLISDQDGEQGNLVSDRKKLSLKSQSLFCIFFL